MIKLKKKHEKYKIRLQFTTICPSNTPHYGRSLLVFFVILILILFLRSVRRTYNVERNFDTWNPILVVKYSMDYRLN
jgi:hypothetical protein